MSVLPATENDWSVDVEGDLIPSTVVYCLCAVNIKTEEERVFTDYESIKAFAVEVKAAGGKFVGHNFLGYDAPTLNKLVGTRIVLRDIVDTFVLSQVYKPGIEGGHSLEAWGQRLDMKKSGFDDFSGLSQELIDRCLQDARIGRKVYLWLRHRMGLAKFNPDGIRLEHEAWELTRRQTKNGFAFDIEGAYGLFARLRQIEADLQGEIEKTFPPILEIVATYQRPFKKDGDKSANLLRHEQEFERVDVYDDRYDCWDYVRFNIGSPDQRVEKLLELGWEPREYTKGGKEKLKEKMKPKPTHKGQLTPSLQEFVDESKNPAPALIARWIDVNARANMINTWIENYNDTTGCIHGTLWLAGTLRYRHSGPNTANIPAVRKGEDNQPLRGDAGVWTYEARALWRSRNPSQRIMVGCDAKGIQLRILANRLGNPTFTRNILSEDPHSANAKDFELPNRRVAKTITYAVLMGAGDLRVSTEAKITMGEAQTVKKKFFAKVPELPKLIARLKNELQSTGRIALCDGTKVMVPSDHMVIPYLLQGDESKIMKFAMVQIDRECRRLGIDAIQVGMIHDELQFDVLREDVERFRAVCLQAFADAGRHFAFNLPIDGDCSLGATWADTH